MTSGDAPGENGTIIRTGRFGKLSADAGLDIIHAAVDMATTASTPAALT
jgi:hypothetical protein